VLDQLPAHGELDEKNENKSVLYAGLFWPLAASQFSPDEF